MVIFCIEPGRLLLDEGSNSAYDECRPEHALAVSNRLFCGMVIYIHKSRFFHSKSRFFH